MQIWMTLILAVQLLSALVMIGLVLLQHGKGADMGASFGSGASGSLFGATGSANFLSRSTAVCAALFFACTLALAYIGSGAQRTRSTSVLDRPSAASQAGAIPGALPTALPASAAGAAASGAAAASAAAATTVAPGAIPAPAGAIPAPAASASAPPPAPAPGASRP